MFQVMTQPKFLSNFSSALATGADYNDETYSTENNNRKLLLRFGRTFTL